MGTKILNWKEVYKLPLEIMKYDEHTYGNYVYSENRVMAITFLGVSSKNRLKIIDQLNTPEKEIIKIDNIVKNGCEFYTDLGKFIVRGWGYLTGIGGLNLQKDVAIKIQDEFIKYIYETLKK